MTEIPPVIARLQDAYGNTLHNLFHISLRHRYLFVHNPKVGSTTIKHSLNRLELKGTSMNVHKVPMHPRITESPLIKPFQLPDDLFETVLTAPGYIRFSFVRDPHARILSCYLDKIAHRRPEAKKIYHKLGMDIEDMTQDISFARFIDFLHDTRAERGRWDLHWRPQTHVLRPRLVDYTMLGRMEQFEQDYDRLNEMMNGRLPALVKRGKHETQARDRVESFYTADLRRKVAEIYDRDFELFGY